MISVQNIKPQPLLSKYIRKFSIFESKSRTKFRHKLTPSPYTYLSYNHKEIPVSVFGDMRIHPKQRLQIAGPKIDEEIYVEYNGTLKQILVEFTASGFYYLFHESPSKMINALSALENFSTLENNFQLEQELKRNDDIQIQIKIIEEYLIEKTMSALPFCNYLEESINLIEENTGNTPIRSIAEQVNISERQLDRKFLEVVGVTPKQYSKIMQLHHVINLMSSKSFSSLQDIAYFADYYDMPHFSRRFKELTGFSPSEFLKSDKDIALKYFRDLTIRK
jgi:AraC-like DNA-binding protein